MVKNQEQLLAATILDMAHMIMRSVGYPGMSGMALVEAYYTGKPWRTAQQVAERAGCSDDTARRQLNALVNVGRADRERQGGCFAYKVRASVAEKLMEMLLENRARSM